MIVVESGGRRAAVTDDEVTARYETGGLIVGSTPARAVADAEPVRVLVEVEARLGGMSARALIGVLFTPAVGERATTDVEVQISSRPLGLGAPTMCTSALGDAGLVPGLPEEFAEAVLRGLADPAGPPLPAGTMDVDRADYDEIGSSNWVFGLTARTLVVALSAALSGEGTEGPVRAVLERH